MTAYPAQYSAESQAGFSLLEALIALSILAIAAAALIGASEAHIDRVGGLEARAVASWVADEQLTELRISRRPPASASKTREMAGRTWQVDVVAIPTDDPEVVRADITVSDPNASNTQTRLSGFVDIGATR